MGKILGLTITLETVDPKRFASPGRLRQLLPVRGQSAPVQRQEERGKTNGKCGNKYLAWAFVEAANRPLPNATTRPAGGFYDRKKAQVNGMVATKALACKLAKAAWHMMSQNADYDAGRMFPGVKN